MDCGCGKKRPALVRLVTIMGVIRASTLRKDLLSISHRNKIKVWRRNATQFNERP